MGTQIKKGKGLFILMLIPILLIGAGIICLSFCGKHGYVIAIDPGHGGTDPGAVGFIKETDLTEGTVKYLEEFLRKDENYMPILCRQYGQTTSIQERSQTATKAKADLLLCVHANSSTDAGASGFECYPAPPGRGNHETSKRFAALITEEMYAIGSTIRGSDGIRYAYYIPDENGISQKKLIDSSDNTVYGYSSFGMVENKNYPAVLAEQCFVTNKKDVAFLGTDEGYRLAAKAYYKAICRYFGTVPMV